MGRRTVVNQSTTQHQIARYVIWPNNRPQHMAIAKKEGFEDVFYIILRQMPGFSFVHFDDDNAVVVGVRANQPETHLAVLKKVLQLLAQINLHQPRAGLDTKVPGLTP